MISDVDADVDADACSVDSYTATRTSPDECTLTWDKDDYCTAANSVLVRYWRGREEPEKPEEYWYAECAADAGECGCPVDEEDAEYSFQVATRTCGRSTYCTPERNEIDWEEVEVVTTTAKTTEEPEEEADVKTAGTENI